MEVNVEEKEKYARHALEVWDGYLSSGASAPEPKPRKQTKLVTRCYPGRLFNVLQRLTPEQKESVKSMGFTDSLDLDVELFDAVCVFGYLRGLTLLIAA
ncbi:hypothetical protein VIGAN_08117500 [Vigna angularis var. angularis]|uniref:Uncharacterized protein n=1 Tax=Vigna angularis var. angularis TaxID=157739 RepID=A0A0S3SP43_PHAAN|nr:hypothetical protein VIGAN_08117500 [Vigna angularis var. angularis]